MNDFETAAAYVHSVLEGHAQSGIRARVSVEALARFKATRPLEKGAPLEGTAPSAPERTRDPGTDKAMPSQPVLSAPPATPREPGPASHLAPSEGPKAERLAAMRAPVLACVKCPHLAARRTQVVFGVGNPEAELMFVGEAPGADEDLQGEPFVGAAGQLLTKIIVAMGFAREQVYIANVLKCRPDMPPGESGNRKPRPEEMATCLPYLREQIEIIQPRVLVALGAVAMEGLTGQTQPMARMRGRWHDFAGTPLMATYHPAYLLRNQALGEKRKVWEDMLMVLEKIGREITAKQQGFFLAK